MRRSDELAFMAALDNGANLFGSLRPEIRARLYAVVKNPSQETWNDANGIILSDFTTLWQALLRHTDFDVTSGPAHGTGERPPWPKLPTRAQLLQAIRTQLGA